MDWERVGRLTPRLPKGLSVDGRVGTALVIAFFGMERRGNLGGGGGGNVEATVTVEGEKNGRTLYDVIVGTDTAVDAAVVNPTSTAKQRSSPEEDCEGSARLAARLHRTQKLVEAVCDGLKTPNSIRKAAVDPLTTARRMLEPLPVQKTDAILAKAVPWTSLNKVAKMSAMCCMKPILY